MAHVSVNQIEEVWKSTAVKNWPALRHTLQDYKDEKIDGITDDLVDVLISVVDDLESSYQSYPTSVEELHRILNERIEDL